MIKWLKRILFMMLLLTSFKVFSSNSTKIHHVCSPHDPPKTALACNVYKEARGEGVNGMLGVGFTTVNRVKNKKFPNKISKVVYQKKQFSWTNNNNTKIHNKQSWNQAQSVAQFLVFIKDYENFYNAIDFTKGSTYYHNKTVNPSWNRKMIKVVTLGNHIWYKEKELN